MQIGSCERTRHKTYVIKENRFSYLRTASVVQITKLNYFDGKEDRKRGKRNKHLISNEISTKMFDNKVN